MDMELCYAFTYGGPPTYREGGFPPKPPIATWWRVISKTHTVEDDFLFLFPYFVNVHFLFIYSCSILLSVKGDFFHSNAGHDYLKS